MNRHCGGPAVRCRVLVVRCPDGLTQVTETVSPGWNRDRTLARPAGEETGCPFTAVMTAPPVRPALAAGLPQIVPSIRAPELTGAMADGTVRSALLAEHAGVFPEPPAPCPCCRACAWGLLADPEPMKIPRNGG